MRRSNPGWRCVSITSPSSRRAVQESRRTLHRAEDAGGQGQISLKRSVHAIRFVEEMKLTNSRVAAGLGRTGCARARHGFHPFREDPMETTSAPICRVCYHAHWLRQPHVWTVEDAVDVRVGGASNVASNVSPPNRKQRRDREKFREYMREYMRKKRAKKGVPGDM